MEGPTEKKRLKDLPKGFKTPEFGITPDFGTPLENFKGRNSKAKETAFLQHQLGGVFEERIGRAYEESGHEGLSPGQCMVPYHAT